MVDMELPKMPRKIKKSKKDKKGDNKRSSSKSSNGAETQQTVKMKVPVEQLTKKQISILKLAESLDKVEFNLKLWI